MTDPILIQGAMGVELEVLLSQLKTPSEIIRGGFQFWKGTIAENPVVLSRTGIGMVNAAAATARGITYFAPSVVLNQGLAGAQTAELHVGDIVLGETAVDIHSAETSPRGRGEGSEALSWLPGERSEVLHGDLAWLQRLQETPYRGGIVQAGRLGAGDVFNREADRIAYLTRQRGHLCEDMESFAAYSVCAGFKLPCVGVRVISNNELTGEPYQRTIAEKLQEWLLAALGNET